jgi:hypothetical protein
VRFLIRLIWRTYKNIGGNAFFVLNHLWTKHENELAFAKSIQISSTSYICSLIREEQTLRDSSSL